MTLFNHLVFFFSSKQKLKQKQVFQPVLNSKYYLKYNNRLFIFPSNTIFIMYTHESESKIVETQNNTVYLTNECCHLTTQLVIATTQVSYLIEEIMALYATPEIVISSYRPLSDSDDLKKTDITVFSNLSWKRSLRYLITVYYTDKIMLNLTFRKFIAGGLKTHTLKSRWLIHSFFFFKNLFLFLAVNPNFFMYLFFKNVNAFFFNTQRLFFEHFYYFFNTKLQKNFSFFFNQMVFSLKVQFFKKIKSVKKFKRKIYSRTNRNYLTMLNKTLS